MKVKRTITLLLAVVMLAGMFPLSAFAASWGEGDTLEDALSELKVGFDDKLLDWLVLPNLGVIYQRYAFFYYKNTRTNTLDQHPVYCIDPTKGGAYEIVQDVGPNDDGSKTATYIRGELVGDIKYRRILTYGYPHMSLSSLGLQTKEEGYYATKLALWMYIRGNDPSKLTINPKYSASDPVAVRVRNAAVSIYQNGMVSQYTGAEPFLKLTGNPSATANLDTAGEYYVQGIEVQASGWVGTNPDVCGDVLLSWESPPPSGTIVLGSDGEDITGTMSVKMTTTNGWRGKVTVKYPATAIDTETFAPPTLKAEAIVPNNGVYTAYAKVDKNAYQRYLVESDPKIKITTSFISQIGTPVEKDFPTDSGLRVRKLEEGTNMPLEGAVFEIRNPSGQLVYSMATNSSGIIDIPLTEAGNYTVTEVTPPVYHLLGENPTQSISVKYGEIAEATFTNAPYGTLRVCKRDAANGMPLSGASIRIRNIATNSTQERVTDSSGTVVFDRLPVGAYEITEAIAPEGYELDIGVKTVHVLPLNQGETSYTLLNKANPGLRIVKFDRQTMTPIAGVTFEAWHDGELYGTYRTDNWGEIELRSIPAGTWTAREVATVEPYVLDATAQWIEIKAGQGHISELVFFNVSKPGIRILKIDSETFEPLVNARFLVKQVGGSYEKEFITDEKGEINLSSLDPSAYTVTELTAPEHYLIDGSGSRTIQINAGESAQFVFTNTRRPSMELIKYDPVAGKYLPGATFRIAKIEDGSHYLDRITDTEGKIHIDDLEPGIYSVQETAAPGGYVLNPTEYHMELFPGKTSTLVVNNEKKPDLLIVKTDAITGEPIQGVTFQVNKADSSTLTTVVTDEKGEALLTALDPGVYTVTEKSVPDGYLLDDTPQQITLVPGKTGIVRFKNHPKPTLTIHKVDSVTGSPVKGAKFQVWYASNNTFTGELNDLGFFYSDEHGLIRLDKLADGWYRITEVEPAHGYAIKDPANQDIFVRAGENKAITFENVPLSALIIRKLDSDTGLPVQGAAFRVRYLGGTSGSGGTVIFDGVTNTAGTIILTGLDAGTYVVDEYRAAPGYELSNPSTQTAYLAGKDTDAVELVFHNAHKGQVLIQKLDSVTKQPLAGAQFKVTDSSGAVIGPNGGIYTSDASGLINLTEYLDVGSTVVIQEVKAPEGYILDTAAQTIKIKENATHTVTFFNTPKGGLLIKKYDHNNKPLKDAVFKVTDSSGAVIGTGNGEYTTDKDGIIHIPQLAPGTYVVTEIKAPDGFILDSTPKGISITDEKLYTLEFVNQPKSGLQIVKIDSETKQPLKGAKFTVYQMNGAIIGTYETNGNGVIILSSLEPGWYKVAESKAPNGYLIDDTPQDVEITSNQFVKLVFENKPIPGLQILKIDEETRRPIPNVEFRVSKMNGEVIGTYRTDSQGLIRIPALEAGWYTATETKSAKGYLLDSTDHSIEVKAGQTATLTITNRKTSGIIIHKIDSVTGQGIPGVTFLLYDDANRPLGQYESDQDGRVYIGDGLPDGKYKIRELQPAPGYVEDTQVRTIYLEYGRTTEIVWENTPMRGQIIITKRSAAFNETTNLPAGSPLPGAVFEVYSLAGNMVDRMASNDKGIAASSLLPLGVYVVKEVTPPKFYALNPREFVAELRHNGDIVRFEVLNDNVTLGVTVQKKSQNQAVHNQMILWDLFNVANTSSTALENFYLHDRLPTDAVRGAKVFTGTWSHNLTYRVTYKTNYSADYKVLASGLSTKTDYELSIHPNVLGLASGEYVTDIRWEFGTVPAGFQSVINPRIQAQVLSTLPKGYKIINRADVGGLYISQWITAQTSWTTLIYGDPTSVPHLPKSGY